MRFDDAWAQFRREMDDADELCLSGVVLLIAAAREVSPDIVRWDPDGCNVGAESYYLGRVG